MNNQNFNPQMNNGMPQQGFTQPMNNGMPQQSFNQPMNNSMPQQGFTQPMNNGMPQQGFNQPMNNGMPQQGFTQPMNNGMPQQGFNQPMNNGMPQQGFTQPMNNGMPQQGFNPQANNFAPNQNFSTNFNNGELSGDEKTAMFNKLPNDQKYMITGTVSYSRIYRYITAEEAKRNAEKNSKANKNAHYTITLSNPIVTGVPSITDPNNPEYAMSQAKMLNTVDVVKKTKIRYSKNDNTPYITVQNTIYNENSRMPIVLQRNPDGTATPIHLEGDFDTGLKVSIVLNPFKGKDNDWPNAIQNVNFIIVEEPIRYYVPATNVNSTLEALGITSTGPITAYNYNAPNTTPNTENNNTQTPVVPSGNYGQPAQNNQQMQNTAQQYMNGSSYTPGSNNGFTPVDSGLPFN